MNTQLEDIRCGHCGRKLAEGRYTELSIKCPRCRALNHFRATSHDPSTRSANKKDMPDA